MGVSTNSFGLYLFKQADRPSWPLGPTADCVEGKYISNIFQSRVVPIKSLPWIHECKKAQGQFRLRSWPKKSPLMGDCKRISHNKTVQLRNILQPKWRPLWNIAWRPTQIFNEKSHSLAIKCVVLLTCVFRGVKGVLIALIGPEWTYSMTVNLANSRRLSAPFTRRDCLKGNKMAAACTARIQ